MRTVDQLADAVEPNWLGTFELKCSPVEAQLITEIRLATDNGITRTPETIWCQEFAQALADRFGTVPEIELAVYHRR